MDFENLSDEEELRLHQLGALASILELAKLAIEGQEDELGRVWSPASALAGISGRAQGALGHVRRSVAYPEDDDWRLA